MKVDSLTRDEVAEALARVLAAPSFQRADRQSALLRYLVDARLGSLEIKESVIALEFFGRQDYDPHADSQVRVEMSKLRQRLARHYDGAGAADPVRLEIPKGAYVVVARSATLAPKAEPVPVAGDMRRSPLATGAVLGIAIVLASAYWLSRSKPQPPPGATYIAVLPFVDMSSGGDQGYFCDGLTEELIHLLSGYSSIRVVSRTSAFQFRGASQDAREVGRKLGAQVVMEGSVRREGNRIRVTAQLINAADGYHLFSETYDREFEQVLAIQEDLAASIGKALRWDLVALGTGRVLSRPRTRNPRAFHQYLLATRKANSGEPAQAIELYKTAVALDPQYALAWAGIANEAITAVEWGLAVPAEELAEASDAARKAMALDDTLAEVQRAAGLVRACYDHDWKGADAAFRRAAELDPEYVYFQQDWVKFALQPVGRFAEAVAILQRALTAQPGNNHLRNTLASVYIKMGQYELARRSLDISLRANPRSPGVHVFLSQTDTAEGRNSDAVRHIEEAARLQRTPWVLGEMSYVYARAGRRADTVKVLAELREMGVWRAPYETAVALCALGDRAGALSSLEQALAGRASQVIWMKFDARLKDLHGEPRFDQLLKKLRLLACTRKLNYDGSLPDRISAGESSMKSFTAVAVVFCGLSLLRCASAQAAADPNLLREADAVRTVLANAKAALGGYTWTEYTEVLVEGKVHSTEEFTCRYNSKGEIVRSLKAETAPEGKPGSATSNKPRSRSKAAKQDYIERAISLIHNYVPPNPDRITAMLKNGTATLGPSEGGKSEIRFQRYFMAGDLMVFKYDTATKALVHASISATLGDKKDPVTLEADFGTLPDGLTHLNSTTLDAKVKKVQVRTRNLSYQKVSN